MAVSLKDLSPAAQQQVAAKLAVKYVQEHNKEKKPSKYHAQKVEGTLVDGMPHTFDSKKEANRYAELALLQRTGQISDLQIQVPFELVPKQKNANGKTERPVIYIADFVYMKNGEKVVEDIKGYTDTASAAYAKYTIKRKLMLWVHHITIKEV